MAKTDLKVYATEAASGKKTTTTLTYVNPAADSQTLKTFGQMLNAFTTNNYDSTDRVQTVNVDTEEVPAELPEFDFSAVIPNPIRLDHTTITAGDRPIQLLDIHTINNSILSKLGVISSLTNANMTVYLNINGTLNFMSNSRYSPATSTNTLTFNFAGTSQYKQSSFQRTFEIY